jgi:putative DNA-invertase from lambdoid prophage Rac
MAERPEGKQLFARLQKGDVVIAAKLDRLFRFALDALQVVEDLRKRGVALHLLDLGGDISGNGMSRFFMTVLATLDEVERDRIRERISDVKRDQRARGRYLGGRVPFGYRRGDAGELIPHECEQQAIQEIITLRGQGEALRAIAGGPCRRRPPDQPRGRAERPEGPRSRASDPAIARAVSILCPRDRQRLLV